MALVEVFTYTITDGDGDVSTATLTITITGSNDAPVIANPNHTVTGAEDGVITFAPADFASIDVDPGDLPEDVRIVNLPTKGTLYLDGQVLVAGSTVSLADVAAGKLTYRPAPDGNGTAYSSFGYQVGDGSDYSATATIGIDIAPRNDTPTASGPTSASVLLDTPISFDGGTGTNHAPALSIDDFIDFSETGATDFFTLTLSVSNGVISIGDPNGALTGEGSGRSLTLTGTREAINAALATLTYRSDRTYFGPDQLVVSVDDHLNAGTGEGAQPGTASHVVDITVAPPPATNPDSLESPDVQERTDESWGALPYDRDRNVFDDLYGDRDYLEGRPIDRYTVTWQPVSQQMLFRQIGNGPLFYEARLGRDLPLPSWISFDASTQIVTAVPDAQVKPGVYTVRVVARDSDGNEAESILTIHVLRDIKKSFDAGAAELPSRGKPAPAERSPAHQEGSAPRTPVEEENPDDANDGSQNSGSDDPGANSPAADDAIEQQTLNSPAALLGDGSLTQNGNTSLTKLLLALGPAGRMIETANFIESLANEGGTAR
ncbi:Ig-like domain-containing protein [Sinorhizobium meliloti]|nr:Ig-like domain-containing protein [Sinorhizobium meliloti]